MGNLQGGKIDWDDLVYTADDAEIRKYRLRSGDVLFNRTNTIDLVGKTAIYNGEQPAVFAGYLIRINVDESVLDSRFLNYILNTEFARRHSAKVLSVAVGQANINAQKLKTYPIPLPPTLAEQEAIAEVLGDADALIESLEQLVAKKRHLKQAAMQQLLTGKKRLPGFELKSGYKQTDAGVIAEDWNVASIESITPPNVKYGVVDGPFGSNLKTIHYRSSGIPIITSGYVTDGEFRAESYIYVDRAKFVEEKRSAVQPGDIVMAKIGERCGASAILPDSHETGILSGNALKITVDESRYSTRYVWHVLWGLHVSGKLELLRTVGAQPALSMPNLKKFVIAVPPTKAEQDAIAGVLGDMDADIAATEAKLAKARQIKQGMMQELLTGRIRLL